MGMTSDNVEEDLKPKMSLAERRAGRIDPNKNPEPFLEPDPVEEEVEEEDNHGLLNLIKDAVHHLPVNGKSPSSS